MKWFLIIIAANGVIVTSSPFPDRETCREKLHQAQNTKTETEVVSSGCFFSKEYGENMPMIFLPDGFKKLQ